MTETVLLHSLDLAAAQLTWGSTAALQWAGEQFTSLTGYSVRSENITAAYDVDWDTSALVLSTRLSTAEECYLAIIGALKTIIHRDREAPVVDTAPDIAPTPSGVVIVLEEKRQARTLVRATPGGP